MKHLGDITKLRGDEIPAVDIITGGSPCQDLSVAGLRKGIKHEANDDDETTRSGLFIVRRLTPTECSRLQGYPDGWLDIGDYTDEKGRLRKEADTAKYKAAGNSIALPWWAWLARRIAAHYERPATMGSLFDGIGGFPLVFLRAGVKPMWASEIEAFPIAVCKKHFGDEDSGIEGDVWKYL